MIDDGSLAVEGDIRWLLLRVARDLMLACTLLAFSPERKKHDTMVIVVEASIQLVSRNLSFNVVEHS